MYLGTVALARYATSLTSPLAGPVGLFDPPVPIDPFNLCLMVPRFRFKSVPIALGTVFGE